MGAGTAAIGVKAIAAFAKNNASVTRPVHSGHGIGRNIRFIRIILSASGVRLSGVTPENRRELLTRHGLFRAEPAVPIAGDYACLRRPRNRGAVRTVGGNIREAGFRRRIGTPGRPVKRRSDHSAGHDRFGRKRRSAVRQTVFPAPDNRFRVPRVFRHVGEPAFRRRRCKKARQQETDKNERQRIPFDFHLHLPVSPMSDAFYASVTVPPEPACCPQTGNPKSVWKSATFRPAAHIRQCNGRPRPCGKLRRPPCQSARRDSTPRRSPCRR